MDELVSAKRSQFADNKRQLTVVGKRNKMRTIDLSDAAFEIVRRAASDGADWLFSHDGQKYKQVSSRWRNLCDGSAGKAGPDNDGIGGVTYATDRRAKPGRTTTASRPFPSTTCVTDMPSITSRPRCRKDARLASTY